MFCPTCKALLKLSAHKTCMNCGALVEGKLEFSEQIKHKSEIKSQEQAIETMATVQKRCPKCGNKTAFFKSQQIAYADEPETEFYKCTKCQHVWRSMYTM
ncbi:MAG: transcription factor S [DPANN group archaeon]|nr:transcription factor S [DPANN group archaeon]